jgi:predicted RecB family endonuclease
MSVLPLLSDPRRGDRNAEARIQAAIVELIRAVAPDLVCFHCPNGGLRGKAEAARLKWIGVLAGIPDLVVLGRDGQTWLVEVKTGDGALSTDQRAMRDRLTAMRVPYVVARSIDDVRRAFAIWGIETRETGR